MAVCNKGIYRQRSPLPEEKEERPLPVRCKARSPLRLEKIFPASTPLCPRETRSVDAVLVRDARLPPSCWRAGWLLRQIEDLCWRELTAETHPFPRRLRPDHTGHPGYVLEEIGNFALRLCPCSSMPQPAPCIPQGTILQPTGFIINHNSYLVTESAVVISRDGALFPQSPKFLGIFPPENL